MSALEGTAASAATSLVLAIEASGLPVPTEHRHTGRTVNEAAGLDW
jgi:hypothetical protein